MTYVFMTCKESLRIVSCWAASSLAVVSVGAATTLVVASGGGLAGGSGKALPVLLLALLSCAWLPQPRQDWLWCCGPLQSACGFCGCLALQAVAQLEQLQLFLEA